MSLILLFSCDQRCRHIIADGRLHPSHVLSIGRGKFGSYRIQKTFATAQAQHFIREGKRYPFFRSDKKQNVQQMAWIYFQCFVILNGKFCISLADCSETAEFQNGDFIKAPAGMCEAFVFAIQ